MGYMFHCVIFNTSKASTGKQVYITDAAAEGLMTGQIHKNGASRSVLLHFQTYNHRPSAEIRKRTA